MKLTEFKIYDKVKLPNSCQIYAINEDRELREYCPIIEDWRTESNIDLICCEDWIKV